MINKPHLSDIFQEVADYYGLTLEEIRGLDRTARVCRPRQMAFYLARKFTEKSLPEIGRFAKRDHTTVIHGIKAAERRVCSDTESFMEMNDIRIKLTNMFSPLFCTFVSRRNKQEGFAE